MSQYYIVELQSGCWLTDREGDPGRTLCQRYARIFSTRAAAEAALSEVRKRYPRNGYKAARITIGDGTALD